MNNIRLTIEYDGVNYAGWQIQPDCATIQATIKAALEKIVKHPVTLNGSGRTDAGVHAMGQVANFLTPMNLPLKAYVLGLNSLLPDDISISKAELVPDEFESRGFAKCKTYRYLVYNNVVPSARNARTSWWLARPLNVEAMSSAAGKLVGLHDFSAFRATGCDAKTSVREIFSAKVEKCGSLVSFEVTGAGFLRHMVRIIAGTLVDVGLEKLSPDEFALLLESGKREHAGMTAPAKGLTLVSVVYDVDALETYP